MKRERLLRGGWVVFFSLLGVVALLAINLIARTSDVVHAIRTSQQDNHSLQISSNQTLQRVLDCTNAKGLCYQRGQAQTAGAIQTINQVAVYASYCAVNNPGKSVAAVTACVKAHLKTDSLKP